jgi:TolB-like protein
LFLAMELLDGEPLNVRLARGPLAPSEAVQTALAVLSALAALHLKGIVHRDLKPSNIFLSPHGVKLLDFGLARPFSSATGQEGELTRPGVLMGSPAYMAPELIEGRPADARSDLFVVGILLFEMLAGKPPFLGSSVFEVARAITHDEPRALGGSAGIVALDRIIHRALRKPAAERFQSADLFAEALRSALLVTDSTDITPVQPMTRLVVLPFRVLRADPSVDFLAFGLADAISSALSGLPSLVVRSTAAASPFATETTDLGAIASALDVDVVLLGTLLSSGDEVRVSAQLVQAPSGTLVRSITAQSTTGEIFRLQDTLAKSIVESLSLALTTRDEGRINRDAPATAEAYECYLRANEIRHDARQWAAARDLYLRCVELDPQFAPAWARLGYCYRLLGKYGDVSQASASLALGEHALTRALTINPDLSLAHNLYAQVEVESGHAREAMVRLLERLRDASSEPELFAGLVHACRYCGLLEASVAAYERGRRLDPGLVTSVSQTFLQMGEFERAMATDLSDPPFGTAVALVSLGRATEGIDRLRAGLTRALQPQLHTMISSMIAYLEHRYDEMVIQIHQLIDTGFGDPEAFFHWAAALAQAGDPDGALQQLERCLNAGFYPASSLVKDPRFDPLRAAADFRAVVRRADELQREARTAFRAAGGPRLLGLPDA